MNAIVAVSSNWGIGRDNQLLFSIPEDMKFFRNITSGKVIIMGRKTLDSFPNGAPLKNRVNIVITRDIDFKRDDVLVAYNIKEAVDMARSLEGYSEEDLFVIGGDSIYGQMMDVVNTIYVTRVEAYREADAFFPELDDDDRWEMTDRSEIKEHEGITYYFATYRRK
ncbi:MAG: dihydrofolate reductase [Clostridiales bacterium]|nr:dihydrofolate reductase [Clostridiales bacterium]